MQINLDDYRWLLVYLANLADLLIALVLALPIGWNREREARSAGLRTFPLVAVASCGFMLIGKSVAGDNPDALARVLYGLMTGIGFIGGGAIVKGKSSVHGTATAASIWNTGAMGAAVAFQRWEIALALSFMNFAILGLITPFKGRFRRPPG